MKVLWGMVVFALSFVLGSVTFVFYRYLLNAIRELGTSNELLIDVLDFLVAGQYSDIIEVVLIFFFASAMTYAQTR